MPELEASSASSSKDTSASLPWWVHLCRWLWKVTAFLGISVLLSLLVNVSATWLTSPKGRIPPDSPFGWLLAHWPITLLTGGGFLFVAVLTGVVSHRQHHPTLLLSPSQQNRTRMLRRLRRSYSDLLAHSLQGAIRMDVGLSQAPDAVHNASNLLLHLPNRPERLLPPGTPIIHAYDEAAHELLILGEPGAGKSTLLLDETIPDWGQIDCLIYPQFGMVSLTEIHRQSTGQATAMGLLPAQYSVMFKMKLAIPVLCHLGWRKRDVSHQGTMPLIL